MFYLFTYLHTSLSVRTGQCSMDDTFSERRLRWLGHVIRMDHQCIPRQALHWEVPGFKRDPGRPLEEHSQQGKDGNHLGGSRGGSSKQNRLALIVFGYFTAIFLPKNKINQKYVHLFGRKIYERHFSDTNNENETQSASTLLLPLLYVLLLLLLQLTTTESSPCQPLSPSSAPLHISR